MLPFVVVSSTHYAGYQGAIAARNILLPLQDPGVLNGVPSTTFTGPEVASVGLSEQQALKEYGPNKIEVLKRDLTESDRAVCESETYGFIKVVCLKRSGQIVGATIVSPSAGELISEISVAMTGNMPFQNLAKVMHPYPSHAFDLQVMASEMYYERTLRLKPVYDILKWLGL